MYQVSIGELGPNALVQNIDILSDCGHYDRDQFPWHYNMVNLQCQKLKEILEAEDIDKTLPIKKRVDLIIGLSRVPVTPVSEVLIKCMDSMPAEKISYYALKMVSDLEYCQKVAQS